MTAFYRLFPDCTELDLRVIPGAKQSKIDGLYPTAEGGERLKIRVNAPPEKGKANSAVIALIAKQLGVSARQITVLRGETSQEKTLRISAPLSAAQCDQLIAL
ncbi:MAG: DUF167 domain-containing protein [Hyphomicrobiales bacterium]|nr:DUF167 domain-containing protein [Hyphomicrobiales bacterium]